MTEDIDKISFAYDIMSRAMSPFAKLLWPLFCLHAFPKNNGFFGATCIISPQRVCIIGFCQSLFEGFLTGGLESESAKGAIIEAPKAPGGVCLSTGSGLWEGH